MFFPITLPSVRILSLIVILLDFGSRLILLVSEPIDPATAVRGVVATKGLDMVLEGALVLEIGATDAVPKLATILLVRSPVPAHGERLTALAAHEGLEAMLALVVCLQGSEVLQRLGPRVVDVVAAPRCAAVARKP